jgi:hypothetical protein
MSSQIDRVEGRERKRREIREMGKKINETR